MTPSRLIKRKCADSLQVGMFHKSGPNYFNITTTRVKFSSVLTRKRFEVSGQSGLWRGIISHVHHCQPRHWKENRRVELFRYFSLLETCACKSLERCDQGMCAALKFLASRNWPCVFQWNRGSSGTRLFFSSLWTWRGHQPAVNIAFYVTCVAKYSVQLRIITTEYCGTNSCLKK